MTIIAAVCAWCEQEGKRTVLGSIESDKPGDTHGICQAHKEKLLAEAGLPVDRAAWGKRAARPITKCALCNADLNGSGYRETANGDRLCASCVASLVLTEGTSQVSAE